MLKGLEQLWGGEQKLEEEHVQWHSWIQGCTSVQGSPSLRSLLGLSLGQLLHWTNSLGFSPRQSLPWDFPAFSFTSGFHCPFNQRFKSPKSLFYFLSFFLYAILTVAQLNSFQQATCPRFPIHSQSGRSRVRKVFQSITHPKSACFGPLHWILTLG